MPRSNADRESNGQRMIDYAEQIDVTFAFAGVPEAMAKARSGLDRVRLQKLGSRMAEAALPTSCGVGSHNGDRRAGDPRRERI